MNFTIIITECDTLYSKVQCTLCEKLGIVTIIVDSGFGLLLCVFIDENKTHNKKWHIIVVYIDSLDFSLVIISGFFLFGIRYS